MRSRGKLRWVKAHTRAIRAAARLSLLVILLGLFVSCRGEKALRSDCVDDPGACPPCAADEECSIVSNTCLPHAACTHRDRDPPLGVIQIGCALEYDEPPPERCGCVDGVCRAR